jgi:serine/threonine-protein kinase PpkA
MFKSFNLYLLTVLTIFAILFAFSVNVYAQNGGKPLLQEGKRTLYKRIITHPITLSYDKPKSEPKNKITPFTVMYVYEQIEINGVTWLRCATNSDGVNTVWINGDRATDFKHSLVATFGELVGRDPVIFFDRKNSLLNILKSPDGFEQLQKLYADYKYYEQNNLPAPENLINLRMEPDHSQGAISSDKFYLMPIINFDNSLQDLLLLDVATIDAGKPDHTTSTPNPSKVGYVFVIDTTISMQPYINSCRDLTQELFNLIPTYKNSDDIYFAFVAFRNSVTKPGIEYKTKVIADFTSVSDKTTFAKALSQVKEATVSTHSFNEDSFAGLKTAYDELSWQGFKGGVVFLLTDAPPLDSNDVLNTNKDTPETILQRAKDKNIRNIVIHLKTAAGLDTHTSAQAIYEKISYGASGTKAYIDILLKDLTQDSGPETFKKIVTNIFNHTQSALGDVAENIPTGNENNSISSNSTIEENAAKIGDLIGYSFLTMDLGKQNKTSPPKVVRSWIGDKDLTKLLSKNRREVPSLQVASFITRNQLLLLIESVSFIIQGAKSARPSEKPLNLFDQILSVAAQFSRDPSQYSFNPQAQTIGETGVLNEFLEGLPYKSEVMAITEKQWDTFDEIRQQEFINGLSAKLEMYQEYYKDENKWFKFDETSEQYTRLPLSLLP